MGDDFGGSDGAKPRAVRQRQVAGVAVEEARREQIARLAPAELLLADEDRDLLALVAWEGMSSAEAAAVLDIPSGTVRSRLHRIRTELAAHEREHHG